MSILIRALYMAGGFVVGMAILVGVLFWAARGTYADTRPK